MLGRSLRSLQDIIDRSLADVRMASGDAYAKRIEMRAFMEELEIGAALGASERGIILNMPLVERDLAVRADPQLLSSAVGNLLHNAFKFTPPQGTVTLSTQRRGGRVLIEVQDACGGIREGQLDAVFQPREQRGSDRTGLGLGLSISRRAIESQGGTLTLHNLSGSGCIFTIDLPAAA